MPTKSRASVRLLYVLSIALIIGGGSAAVLEARPYLDAGVTPATKFSSLEEGRAKYGLSSVSRRLVLDNCFDAMRSVYGRTQLSARRKAVAEDCRKLADGISDTTPTSSFALYIGALAASQLDDFDGMNTRVSQSQIVGPFEQWVAELRVDLVESNFSNASPEVLDQHNLDLKLLAQSERGVASIGDRYVRDESFRQRIFAIVETLPNQDQARFVEMVKRATLREVSRLQ